MSSPPASSGPDSTSPTVQNRREEVLDRFESAWRSGSRPLLVEYVAQVPETERPVILRELLKLDSDYRQRAGDSPRVSDYMDQLPEFETEINTVLGADPYATIIREASDPYQTVIGGSPDAETRHDATIGYE